MTVYSIARGESKFPASVLTIDAFVLLLSPLLELSHGLHCNFWFNIFFSAFFILFIFWVLSALYCYGLKNPALTVNMMHGDLAFSALWVICAHFSPQWAVICISGLVGFFFGLKPVWNSYYCYGLHIFNGTIWAH